MNFHMDCMNDDLGRSWRRDLEVIRIFQTFTLGTILASEAKRQKKKNNKIKTIPGPPPRPSNIHTRLCRGQISGRGRGGGLADHRSPPPPVPRMIWFLKSLPATIVTCNTLTAFRQGLQDVILPKFQVDETVSIVNTYQ